MIDFVFKSVDDMHSKKRFITLLEGKFDQLCKRLVLRVSKVEYTVSRAHDDDDVIMGS